MGVITSHATRAQLRFLLPTRAHQELSQECTRLLYPFMRDMLTGDMQNNMQFHMSATSISNTV